MSYAEIDLCIICVYLFRALSVKYYQLNLIPIVLPNIISNHFVFISAFYNDCPLNRFLAFFILFIGHYRDTPLHDKRGTLNNESVRSVCAVCSILLFVTIVIAGNIGILDPRLLR